VIDKKFESEAEEAEWWYENREMISRDFAEAVQSGEAKILTKAESNNKLDKCLRRAYSKVDDQVHARAVCFGSGKAMVEGIPHVE